MKRLGLWGSVVVLFCSLLGCGAAAKDAKYSPGAMERSGGMGARATDADSDELAIEEGDAAEAAPSPPEPAPAPSPVAARTPATGAAGAPAPAKAAPRTEAAHEREAKAAEAVPAGAPPKKPQVASQLLVYTADVRVRVREIPKAIDAVEKLAKDRGGYLVLRQDNQITVRVPSAKFDAALDELLKLGEVVHRNVSIEDVTDLYMDLQTRMKNLQVVKKRLEELLEKAKTVEESLAVQRQLERVTIELERLRGKLELIAELVMFSTISVTFELLSSEQIASKVRLPFPWMDRLGLGELLRL